MAKKIKQLRGLEKDLPVLEEGQIGFTTDTKKVFIGSKNGNIEITKEEEIKILTQQLEQKAYKSHVSTNDFNISTTTATTGFNQILASFSTGKVNIKGDLTKTHTINQELVVENKQDILFEDINFTGNIARSISLKECKNITFRNCKFINMQRAISLYNTENITVENCTFDYCGYHVLGMTGYSQKTTRVLNNNVYNARGDFVEMNSATVESDGVLVMGNVFHGSSPDALSPSHLYTEQRFVGITRVKNVIVTNNIVKNTNASAVHLEEPLGAIIVSGNQFENCIIKRKTNEGNRIGGIVEISGAGKDIILSDNHFIKSGNYVDSDGDTDDSMFLFFNYFESTRPVIIKGNIFDCNNLPSFTQGTTKWSCFRQNKGGILFEGNKVINCTGFDISDTTKMTITNNTFDGKVFSNYGCVRDAILTNNRIEAKETDAFAIHLREAVPTVTENAKNVIITNNFINKPMEMRNPLNIILSNNMMPASVAIDQPHVVDKILALFPTNLRDTTTNVNHSNNTLST